MYVITFIPFPMLITSHTMFFVVIVQRQNGNWDKQYYSCTYIIMHCRFLRETIYNNKQWEHVCTHVSPEARVQETQVLGIQPIA